MPRYLAYNLPGCTVLPAHTYFIRFACQATPIACCHGAGMALPWRLWLCITYNASPWQCHDTAMAVVTFPRLSRFVRLSSWLTGWDFPVSPFQSDHLVRPTRSLTRLTSRVQCMVEGGRGCWWPLSGWPAVRR